MDGPPRNVANQADDTFQRVVVPEIPVLVRVANALTRDRDDADDLVQETLLRAFRAIGRFDGSSPRPWLLTIMRNTNINRNRRRRPHLLDDPDTTMGRLESETSSTDLDPEDSAIVNEFVELVMDAVNRLPEKLRSVIQLVDIEGLSYPETAAILGIPNGTVMSRVHRARLRIRKEVPTASSESGGRPESRSRRSAQ